MRQILRIATWLGASMLLIVVTTPARADTTSNSPTCGKEAHITVVEQDGKYQAQPGCACVGNRGTVYWDVDPGLQLETRFVDDDAHSPFPPGHNVHHGKSHEKVTKDCPKKHDDKGCPYSYTAVFVDSTGVRHPIDPTIIIKAITLERPANKKGGRAKPPSGQTKKPEKK